MATIFRLHTAVRDLLTSDRPSGKGPMAWIPELNPANPYHPSRTFPGIRLPEARLPRVRGHR